MRRRALQFHGYFQSTVSLISPTYKFLPDGIRAHDLIVSTQRFLNVPHAQVMSEVSLGLIGRGNKSVDLRLMGHGVEVPPVDGHCLVMIGNNCERAVQVLSSHH